MTLNNRIRKRGRETLMYQWRKAKNLSLADIAAELGVTREAVRLWENGVSRTSMENIIVIARVLGVKPYDIERHFAIESMQRRGLVEDGGISHKKEPGEEKDGGGLLVS